LGFPLPWLLLFCHTPQAIARKADVLGREESVQNFVIESIEVNVPGVSVGYPIVRLRLRRQPC
jgi:hypothetical protein